MQRLYYASLVGLAMALAGCSNDPDETPDITEAIPLDAADPEETDGAGSDGAGSDGAGSDGNVSGDDGPSDQEGSVASGETSRNTPALPAAPAPGERALPGTMEAGSNPPGFTGPSKGSKVQRIN